MKIRTFNPNFHGKLQKTENKEQAKEAGYFFTTTYIKQPVPFTLLGWLDNPRNDSAI